MSNVFEEYNLTLQDAKARIKELESQVAEANRRYESSIKTLKFANDGWTETIGERDNWRRVAAGLAAAVEGQLKMAFSPASLACRPAQDALSRYNKAKAEVGR